MFLCSFQKASSEEKMPTPRNWEITCRREKEGDLRDRVEEGRGDETRTYILTKLPNNVVFKVVLGDILDVLDRVDQNKAKMGNLEVGRRRGRGRGSLLDASFFLLWLVEHLHELVQVGNGTMGKHKGHVSKNGKPPCSGRVWWFKADKVKG